MHLMDDAKLWWRLKVNGIKNWSCTKNHGKTIDGIEAIDAHLDGFPIKDLMFDVSFEERATRSNNKKRGGSSENSTTHIKKRVEELDITQKIMLKLFRHRTKDSRTTTPKIHCHHVVRISGFYRGDPSLILDNKILFSYFFYFIVSSFVTNYI